MNPLLPFLRRWSRLKLQQQAVPAPATLAEQPLPVLETLDFDADFSAFMQPQVDATTRSQALRKLFMTDHYRAMDGLDVYVDDYSSPAPLTAAMLATLEHTHNLLPPAEEPVASPAPQQTEQA
jgi:hypothetical protein